MGKGSWEVSRGRRGEAAGAGRVRGHGSGSEAVRQSRPPAPARSPAPGAARRRWAAAAAWWRRCCCCRCRYRRRRRRAAAHLSRVLLLLLLLTCCHYRCCCCCCRCCQCWRPCRCCPRLRHPQTWPMLGTCKPQRTARLTRAAERHAGRRARDAEQPAQHGTALTAAGRAACPTRHTAAAAQRRCRPAQHSTAWHSAAQHGLQGLKGRISGCVMSCLRLGASA